MAKLPVGNQPIALAVQILQYLADQGGEHGVRELARELTRGKSSVQRALSALQQGALVTANPVSDKYTLGPGIIRIAAPLLQEQGLAMRSIPVMRQLRDLSGETVTLSVAVGHHRIIIQEVESLHELRWVGRVGYPYPLHTGATGKCLMSLMADGDLHDLLGSRKLEACTPKTLTDFEQIMTEVRLIRSCGHAVSSGEWASGGAGLAVPLRSEPIPMVFGLYGPESRLTPEKMQQFLPALLESVEAIGSPGRRPIKPTGSGEA